MAKRRLTTVRLSDELLRHCTRHSLATVQDVLELPLLDAMHKLRLSAHQARALHQQLAQWCAPQRSTAWDVLQQERQTGSLPSGHAELDCLLAGGFQRGTLTELAGPPGVGKTQWCMSLAAQCVLGSGCAPAPVIYIDTEATLTPQRVVEILTERLPESEQAKLPALLADIVVHRPGSVEHLHEILEQLELQCLELGAQAVFVDSIASLARQEFPACSPGLPSAQWQKTLVLAGWAARLKTLAANCKLSVVVTNQVTSRNMSVSDNLDEDVHDADEDVAMTSYAATSSSIPEAPSFCVSDVPSCNSANTENAKPSVHDSAASASSVNYTAPESAHFSSPAAGTYPVGSPEESSTFHTSLVVSKENTHTKNNTDLQTKIQGNADSNRKRGKFSWNNNGNVSHLSVPSKVQAISVTPGKYKYVTPALGNTWTHFVNTRLVLQYTGDLAVRQLVIAKSPVSPLAMFEYTVTPAGIRVVEGHLRAACRPSQLVLARPRRITWKQGSQPPVKSMIKSPFSVEVF